MYERFTDRARKVMQLANQEAQRLNHETIHTGHILSGIARELTGVAGNALRNLMIDLREIPKLVEAASPPGPDMVTMGKLPQGIDARRAVHHAIAEAQVMGHGYVGSEHLLIGLAIEPCLASDILDKLGAPLDKIRAEVAEILKPEPPKPDLQAENDQLRVTLLHLHLEIEKALGMVKPK